MARRAVSNSFTWADVAIILMVALLCAFLFFEFYKGNGDNVAVIEIEGAVYDRYRLSEYNKTKTIEIVTDYGYNKVQISTWGIQVIEANCPDQVDVKRGLIKNRGESIVCLPHKLVIYIEGDGEYDSISY